MSVIKSYVQSVHYIWKIRSLRCNLYTINGRIGTSEGLGDGILEGFGVSGVDLQGPGNDFCGFVDGFVFPVVDLYFQNLQNLQCFKNFQDLQNFKNF